MPLAMYMACGDSVTTPIKELSEELDDRFGAARTVVEDNCLLQTHQNPQESYAHLAKDIQLLAR